MILKQISLQRFCGFVDFTAQVGEFSVFVGLNNSGKSTVLRAVKFVLDAFRIKFGDGHQPNLSLLQEDQQHWTSGLQHAASRAGVVDLNQLYFGKDRHQDTVVSLVFRGCDRDVVVEAICKGESNNVAVKCLVGNEQIQQLGLPDAPKIVEGLYAIQAQFVPPVGTISPTENVLHWSELQKEIARGNITGTWRNHLHWLNDGQDPEFYQRVVDRVREYVGEVRVRPPKRSRQQNTVEVTYVEHGVEYDVSASGGGVRTLITLAAAMELSAAQILLFDEPDSHLHSSVQRQVARFLADQASDKRQILLATHAPDVIEEVPFDSLLWIDRTTKSAQSCDDVGKTLVSLGAVSHTQAIQFLGADTILYFEAKPDRRVFEALMKRCGMEQLVSRSRIEALGGFGDAKNVSGALRIITKLRPMKVAIVVMRDADYTQLAPAGSVEEQDGLLEIRLPCKELENLLLVSPKTIADAARRAAEARASRTGAPPQAPTLEQIDAKISECSQADDVKSAIENQWICRWLEAKGGRTDPGKLTMAQREFRSHWESPEWRRRCCSGKLVLRHLRRWLQGDPYNVSIPTPTLFAAYEPGAELRRLFDELQRYVIEATNQAN